MISPRLKQEEKERDTLSPLAVLACNSKGRDRREDDCEVRTCFQRDRDRIVYSNAFRRLKHKTQVFVAPEGDHYRTRLTHTLEVAQIARAIARSLSLNEDLCEACALGHDLGHTPFGHAGERALAELSPHGFRHNEQSLRVVEQLENDGEGLNLTAEVRDGILCHSGGRQASTLEGRIIHIADRIAYINHDIDDSIRAGVLKDGDIPSHITDVLGKSSSKRINTLVIDTINVSARTCGIAMSDDIRDAMLELRAFLFERVYTNPAAKGEETKVSGMLSAMYGHLTGHPDLLPRIYDGARERDGVEVAACDYIAGMTDRFCIHKYTEFFVAKGWSIIDI